MGLALGLCLVSGASAVLMVSVPAPPAELGPSEEAAESLPVGGDGEGSESGPRTAPDDAASSSAEGRGQEPDEESSAPASSSAPSARGEEEEEDAEAEEEVPVLLRSVEEEVDSADGDMAVVEGEGDVMGEGPLTTFAVEVEEGLPGEAKDFADAVEQVLGDPRSWGNDGKRSMQRVDGDDADVRVLLAAPDTVDQLCAPLNTNGYVSCANGNRAIINQNRWVSAVEEFEDDLETYRIYVINHEVGHTLGHGHVSCPGEEELAPVMQQQTLSLQGCEANGWVHPENDPED
ncbi:DUF3152 domain-containing protein [Nocardiopsis sp. NRRL B-16309]|uniref:DUF3152 domain-containing protein n=1 Tax=Nocardiopsis sp. NRRL B-16309 TaxID=1519494 RepID=UPI0006AD886A|nr:DUF3152 domain-containing protein [Nocardiopsis sp. NRRL B-16309]KOX18253.1 hypothetical protein ADL05_07205 [Nocardiopsis sp. NRRL B-16309]